MRQLAKVGTKEGTTPQALECRECRCKLPAPGRPQTPSAQQFVLNRSNARSPHSDCRAANRNTPRRSRASIVFTPPLQRLHTPSNRMMGCGKRAGGERGGLQARAGQQGRAPVPTSEPPPHPGVSTSKVLVSWPARWCSLRGRCAAWCRGCGRRQWRHSPPPLAGW